MVEEVASCAEAGSFPSSLFPFPCPCRHNEPVYPPSADASPLPTRTALPNARIGAILEVIICSGFPTQLLLIAVLRGFGMPHQLGDGALNPNFVFAVSLLDAALVIGLVLLFLRAHHESAREVLIGRVRVLREVLAGIGLIP